MPYTAEVMENPEWSLTLKDETPRSVLDQIALAAHAFSTIVITPYEDDPGNYAADDFVGGPAEFLGRFMEQSRDLLTLSGDGIIGWLGNENEGGNMYAGVDGTSANLDILDQLDARIFTSFANYLTVGFTGTLPAALRTMKTPGNTTRRQFLDTICSLYPGGPYEWKQAAFDVSVGRRGALYPTADNPTVILARDGGVGATTGSRRYLSVDGTGDYATTPDTAALDLTDQIDLRIRVRASDYSTGTEEVLLAKWDATGNRRAYMLALDATGELRVNYSLNGTAVVTETATGTSLTDGSDYWLRATLDITANPRVTTFYKSSDTTNNHANVTWTLIDTNSTALAASTLHNSNAALRVASATSTTSSEFAGRVYAAAVLDGVDESGVVVADPVFAEWPAGDTTEPDAAGLTWTLQGDAFIAGTESSTITGLPSLFDFDSSYDVWDYVTDVDVRWNDGTDNGQAANNEPSGWVAAPGGGSMTIRAVIDQSPRVPFKDRTRRWSARVGGNMFAAWALNSQTQATETAVAVANAADSYALSVTAEVDVPDISRYVECGDTVYAWDQRTGLIATENEVEYRGEPAHPMKLRVQRMEIPITSGKGVFLRVWDGAEFDYIDLTRYVDWEEGPAILELGTKRWNTKGLARPKKINRQSFLRRYRQQYKLGRLTFGN